MKRFSLDVDKSYAVFLLSSTIFTYSIHRIVGIRKVSAFADQGRFAVIVRYRTHIIVYAVLSAFVCAFSFFQFSWARAVMLLGAGLISISYTVPIFGKSRRLRDFSFIKIFLIAIVWAFVTESIPLYENGIDDKIVAMLFVERVLFFLAITIPFDIRDIEVDRSNGVETIPSLMGRSKSIFLSLTLLVVCVTIELGLYNSELAQSGSIAAIIAYLISGVMIYTFRNKVDDYYFSGLLDGAIMLPVLVFWVIG